MPWPARGVLLLVLAVLAVGGESAPRPFQIQGTPLGLDFVFIPATETPMRWVEGDGQRIARLSAFWCARHGLTKAMYRRFAAESGVPVPESFGPPTDVLAQSAADFHAGALKGRYLAPTETHVFARIPTWHIEAVLAWARRQLGRDVQLISEAQFEAIRRSGEDVGARPVWWLARQPSGLGCWLANLDVAFSEPAHPSTVTPGLWPQTPWRIWLDASEYVFRDRPMRRLPAGRYDDPVVDEIDPTIDNPSGERQYLTRYYPSDSMRLWSRVNHPHSAGNMLLVMPLIPADTSQAPPVAVAIPAPREPATLAPALPRTVVTLPGGVPLALREVPAGTMRMGRPIQERAWLYTWPQTEVRLRAFAMGETEVTQAQFEAVTGINPSMRVGPDLPVHRLTVPMMVAFAQLLTRQERAAGRLDAETEYRLPSEPEWEYAAQSGQLSRYPWGDDPAQAQRHEWLDMPEGPLPVARLEPNAWGFHDLGGNVMEVMYNYNFEYPGKLVERQFVFGPRGRIGQRMVRGSAWNMGLISAEPVVRRSVPFSCATWHIGFRIVRGPTWDAVMPDKFKSSDFNPEELQRDAGYRRIMERAAAVP
jgi:hypothetical protein